MLRIPRQTSLILSMTMVAFFGAAASGFACILPYVVNRTLELLPEVNISYELTDGQRVLLIVLVYLMLALALTADGLLFAMLMRIRKGAVFTARTVALIRGVSWCCMLFAAVTFVTGWLYSPILLGGYIFAGVTMNALMAGLCLRVVKNVIEEATAIKSENDLTV
ncbi:MAG: DUF2975 domain-containing protein [Clostridia bacterium]|nr:DUF2975 domain-containing protein [Clostridia bacterium]